MTRPIVDLIARWRKEAEQDHEEADRLYNLGAVITSEQYDEEEGK